MPQLTTIETGEQAFKEITDVSILSRIHRMIINISSEIIDF